MEHPWWAQGDAAMDATTAEAVIRDFLKEIRNRLDEVSTVAKAAEACAEAGNIKKAVEIALDIDQPLYETTTLLNAASLINRIRDS
jgi:ATP/maltotriose-dependent transcriptional regulator MalT